MLGQLPQTLNVHGHDYAIRTDFRSILKIITANNDKDLSDNEKVFICLKRIYVDFAAMPREIYADALKAAIEFMECRVSEDRPGPKTFDWEKDEQLIFPAINKVAGMEIRSLPYLHWWTFLGYFQAIDTDTLWGCVLAIRQKRAKHKKLDKHESEFYAANRDLCSIERTDRRKTPEDQAKAIYQELLAQQQEGGEANGG